MSRRSRSLSRSRIELDGALAVVTGAGSGIGRATSLALARAGARVVAVDIALDAAEKTSGACGEVRSDAGAEARVCDVADAVAVQALADNVIRTWHAPDVLVNNAGVGMSGRLADMALDDWRWLRSINLDGVVHGCKAFGPAMLERGRGHVVNLSSALAYTPRATEPAYVTSKAAVLALSQCLRADWRPRGVSVSAICPGVINTPIIDTTRFLGDQSDPDVRERTIKLFRRGHRPETVAQAILGAIRTDRTMAAVGWEAKLGWLAHRVLPLAAHQLPARTPL
jgi:NAD(P)-dependent dehydrogenase (short-subunit alcohol dehydrogenase family)